MPNFTPTKLNRANVTKGRRVTLPPLLVDIQENDQLVFDKMENGVYVFRKIPQIVDMSFRGRASNPQHISKIPLFGAMIGQSLGNGRWYGIITDSHGLIKLRISSSSKNYLRKDLVELPDRDDRNKLNDRCGIDQWSMPMLVQDDTCMFNNAKHLVPEPVRNIIHECEFGLINGSWPPRQEP